MKKKEKMKKKASILVVCVLVASFFIKIPVQTRVMLTHGMDFAGIAKAVEHPATEWLDIYKINKDKVSVTLECGNKPMVFADKKTVITLPHGWQVPWQNKLSHSYLRFHQGLIIIEGPRETVWEWLLCRVSELLWEK